MKTPVAERAWARDSHEPLGLTNGQIRQLANQAIDEIQTPPSSGRSPGAFYFRRRLESGDWLTQGMGRHPANNGLLVYDFPHLDDPYVFYSHLETVYLPDLYSAPAARELATRVFDDRQPDFQPLLRLPALLKRPEADRPRYQELTTALNVSIDQTRARLADLGCQLPKHQQEPKNQSPDPKESPDNLIGPEMPASLAIIRLLESDKQIRAVSQIVYVLNLARNEQIDLDQAHSLLFKLGQKGLIQPVSQGHYAACSVNLSRFEAHQLPGPTTDRTVSLINANPDREWYGLNLAAALNQAGSRFDTVLVEPSQAQSCLQYLARQKRIKSTRRGFFAAWENPKPAYQAPPLTPTDNQIIDLLGQNPNQSFSKDEVVEDLQTKTARPPSPRHIRNRIQVMAKEKRIKKVSYSRYADREHPDPAYQAPAMPIASRVLEVVDSQPGRRWKPIAVHRIANTDPNAGPLTLPQVQSSLAYLANQAGKIDCAATGRGSKTKAKHYISQKPAKVEISARIGSRIGRLTQNQPNLDTPDRVVDALYDDGWGLFNYETAYDLAELALRRRAKPAPDPQIDSQ